MIGLDTFLCTLYNMHIGYIVDNMIKHEGRKVENYNFESDFQILTIKEKRVILKNAKSLLKLQKEGGVLISVKTPLPQK